MAINKISGNILADNLQRGANLAIQGNLIYFDVDNNRVGILTSTPSAALDVGGNFVVGNVTINLVGNIDAGNVNINNLLEPVDNYDAATKLYVDNVAANANIGNFTFSNTTISTSVIPGNITLSTTGNSLVYIDTVSGLALPLGDQAARPLNPPAGTIRFNIDTSYAEVYDGFGWDELIPGGTTTILNQTITPDGIASTYTLDQTATAASILVTINGVGQTPDVDYTVTGTDITFTAIPLVSDIIQIRFLAGVSSTDYITNANGNAVVRADSTGNVTLQASAGQNINVTGNIIVSGKVSAVGNIAGNYVLGNGAYLSGLTPGYGNSNVAAYLTTYSGNITASNISATGNIAGANVLFGSGIVSGTGNINGNVFTATAVNSTTVSASGNITGGNVLFGAGVVSGTGNVTGNIGTFTTHNGTTFSASGNVTGGNLSVTTGTITVGNIVNSNSNGVGNIGTSSNYFNTVFAKSTSALYADLAERFLSDQSYDPGTVLIYAGDKQVTACTNYADYRAAGIVSTNPAYLMNNGVTECAVSLALAGQVPCKVIGPLHKGDILTTSILEGYACKLDSKDWQPGVIVGKALENCGPGPHVILAVALS